MPSPPEPSPQHPLDDFIRNPLRIRCVEVVEIVTHYLDGALDDRDRAMIETHLAGCENCVVFVSQIRLTVKLAAATSRSEDVELPANTAELARLIANRKAT